MSGHADLLNNFYQLFNLRDVDAIVPMLHPEVIWAIGLEAGYLRGRDEVRNYWIRQWRVLDLSVIPLGFISTNAGSTKVELHQIVTDLEGKVLIDSTVAHTFWVEDGLVSRFEIG